MSQESRKPTQGQRSTDASSAREAFDRQARAYADYRPTYPEGLYAFIFRHVARRRYAWDCGTGSGQVAARLSNHFERVYATDRSAAQLEHAVRKANITYGQGVAEETDFPSDYFDLITVAQAIHWFDLDRFYAEARRTATDGALLAVFGYGRVQVDPSIDPIIQKLYDKTFGTYYADIRQHIEAAYQTIPFPFEEIAAPPFVIQERWGLDRLQGYFSSWSAVQRMKSEEGTDPTKAPMDVIRRRVAPGDCVAVSFDVFLRLGAISK